MSDLSGSVTDLAIAVEGLTAETANMTQIMQALFIHQLGGDSEMVIRELPREFQTKIRRIVEQNTSLERENIESSIL